MDKKFITTSIHLKTQSQPIVHDDVINSYEKGAFFCIQTANEKVFKYPIADIWRVIEDYGFHGRK